MRVRVAAWFLAVMVVGRPSAANADTPLGPPNQYLETCTLERQCADGVACVEGNSHTPAVEECKPTDLASKGFVRRCESAFRRDERWERIDPVAIYCPQNAPMPSYDDCTVERQCPNAGVECDGHVHTGVGYVRDGDGKACENYRFKTRCWTWNPSRSVLCDPQHPQGREKSMPWPWPIAAAGVFALGSLIVALWRRRARRQP